MLILRRIDFGFVFSVQDKSRAAFEKAGREGTLAPLSPDLFTF